MRIFCNIIWHIPYLGFMLALFTAIGGLFWCITIVGIPLGLGMFQLSLFYLAPHTHRMVSKSDLALLTGEQQNTAYKVWAVIIRILYFPFGLVYAFLSVLHIGLNFVTLLGIPNGVAEAKALGTIFNPINKKCVPLPIAEEIDRLKAERMLNKYSNRSAATVAADGNACVTPAAPENVNVAPQIAEEKVVADDLGLIAGNPATVYEAAVPETQSAGTNTDMKKIGLIAAAFVLGIVLTGTCFWLFSKSDGDKDGMQSGFEAEQAESLSDETDGGTANAYPAADNEEMYSEEYADDEFQPDESVSPEGTVDEAVDLQMPDVSQEEPSAVPEEKETLPVAEEKETVVQAEAEDNNVYSVVEQAPQFPDGGEAGLLKFIGTHLRYPAICAESGISGTVKVAFVVNKDGSVSDFKVIRSVDKNLDNEALRVLKSMPKWKPGKQNGRPVRVRYNVPVRFNLI